MRIEKLVLGAANTNCYFLNNENTNEVIIIDPASTGSKIEAYITKQQWKPVAILLTHGHFDHIQAADDLRNLYKIKVYAHEMEQEMLADKNLNVSTLFGMPFETKADILVRDGDVLVLAGFQIEVLATPGHTSGSVCYHIAAEEVLISGDTLFLRSYGRTDFPTGDMATLKKSIENKLFTLPDETRVYPGHEGLTQMGQEKQWNPIL